MSRVAFAGFAAVVLSVALASPADAGWRKRGWWGPAPIIAAPVVTPQVFVPQAFVPSPVVTVMPAPVFQPVVPSPVVTVAPSFAWSTPVVTAAPTVVAPQAVITQPQAVVAPAPVTMGWVATRPNCGVYRYWDGGACVDARFAPPVLVSNW